MTKTEARAFRKRWALVNAREREELRSTSPAQKFRQLAALMASAEMFDGPESRAEEVNLVRERWNRLRRIHGV